MPNETKRVQRKREKDWKMPKNTIYVGRPSRWGNPHRVVFSAGQYYIHDQYGSKGIPYETHQQATERAVVMYGFWLYGRVFHLERDLSELSEKNLCCYCSETQTCHADVLLQAVKMWDKGEFPDQSIIRKKQAALLRKKRPKSRKRLRTLIVRE